VSTAVDAVAIRWREARTRALVWYALAFIPVLLYIAFGHGQFAAVHRGLMATGALALGYFVAAQLANVTRVSVRGGALLVEHGPLPWRGRVEVPLDQVRRVRVDAQSARLELRTKRGEDVVLLDELLPSVAAELDRKITSMLEAAR
jgi:hypothetical protein